MATLTTEITMAAKFALSRVTQIAVAALFAAFLAVAPTSVHAQSVVVLVGGEAITNFDIEQRSKLTTLTAHKTPSRQDVIQELIDEKLKVKEGKKFGIDLTASDVDGAFANMASRMRMNADQLAKVLEAQGVRPDTLKGRLKAETAWTALVRGRYKASLIVGEKDIESAVNSDAQPVKTESFEYQLRPVVLFVPAGSAPALIDQRRKEAEILRGKIQGCDQAIGVFRAMRDGTIRDQIVKTSADLPGAYRELLDKTPIGQMTAPEVTKQGIEMVVLCDRKTTTIDTPAKRAARDKLFVEKYEAKSKSYLEELRRGALIEYR